MKKVWIIIAASLVVAGGLIFVGALSSVGFDFSKLNTQKYVTNTYDISDDFSNIIINCDTADVVFKLSEDGKCKVVCNEQEKLFHEVSVKDGALVIDIIDSRAWYDHISFFGDSSEIILYLPANDYGALNISTDTGDINIPKELGFGSISIKASTADINVSASAKGKMSIKTSTGDVILNNVTAKEMELSASTGDISVTSAIVEGYIVAETDTGEVRMTTVHSKGVMITVDTGDITLNSVISTDTFDIKGDTADVRFIGCDAEAITVETDTGDVTGTLLSDKIFITKTSTGDISVPESTSGGRCKVTTSTGDIKLSIVK
ncbi:MAG: DUF4097 domain-containing protein [Ruminococcaceae bacterium]|nr:DUF4097 domain-containing protein [Oscillospiraceae bacterium]